MSRWLGKSCGSVAVQVTWLAMACSEGFVVKPDWVVAGDSLSPAPYTRVFWRVTRVAVAWSLDRGIGLPWTAATDARALSC